MSHYRVDKRALGATNYISTTEFDNKEDAEHYAKNQSVADNEHEYVVQINDDAGDFYKIKAYFNGDKMGENQT